MKKVFLDVNVIVDFLIERDPFYDAIVKLISLADQAQISIVTTPLSFATTHYLISKVENKNIALKKLQNFKLLCHACTMNDLIVEKALNSQMKDFEDALQYYSAINSQCQVIITRDGKDFKNSEIPVMTPSEFLSQRKHS